MIIELSNIGLLGIHIHTKDYEEMFIIQNKYIQQILIVNMN